MTAEFARHIPQMKYNARIFAKNQVCSLYLLIKSRLTFGRICGIILFGILFAFCAAKKNRNISFMRKDGFIP